MRLAIYQTLARTRAVTVNDDMTVTIDDDPNQSFTGQVYPPRQTKGKDSDGSPRSNTPRNLVWVTPGAPEVRPGDRFSVNGVEYEILSGPVSRRAGLQILANEFEAAPVTSVYPLLAQLNDLGGEVVEDFEEIPVAIWEGSETTASHGEYDDLFGEAPAEFFAELNVNNREIVVGSRTFRITSTLLHIEAPHVKLRLRTADA